MTRTHTLLRLLIGSSCVTAIALIATLGAQRSLSDFAGIVLPTKTVAPRWLTITEPEVESGATVPAGTHVIFHLPANLGSISRTTLFGRQSGNIRYWGYCFVEGYDPLNPPQSQGFPGKLFLSEAERKWRAERDRQNFPFFSIFRPPTRRDIDQMEKHKISGVIRHQLERFLGGQTCYVMTETRLSIGTDRDGDGLNAEAENGYRTDPRNADTDGDGISDSKEIFSLFTNPLFRDSDGDGLIEGFEDKNLNGVIDPGETNPTRQDSDLDELCDGYCRTGDVKKICRDLDGFDCLEVPYGQWRGEDKNLNGKLDTGETNPLKMDTDGDGVRDDQEFFNCLLARKTDC